MATLANQPIVNTGLAASYSAADAVSDTFVNLGTGRQFLHIKNADAGVARVVTVTPSVAATTKPGFGDLTVDPIVANLALASEEFLGPFPSPAFDDAVITYDDESDLTLALVSI